MGPKYYITIDYLWYPKEWVMANKNYSTTTLNWLYWGYYYLYLVVQHKRWWPKCVVVYVSQTITLDAPDNNIIWPVPLLRSGLIIIYYCLGGKIADNLIQVNCELTFFQKGSRMRVIFLNKLVFYPFPLYNDLGPLLLTWINFNPRLENSIHYQMWDENTYSFPNFSGWTVEVWEWISNFIPHFIGHVITFRCWYQSSTILVKGPW